MTSEHDQKRLEAARIRQIADGKRSELQALQASISQKQKQIQDEYESNKIQVNKLERKAGDSSLGIGGEMVTLRTAEATQLKAEDAKRKGQQEIEKLSGMAQNLEAEVKNIERDAYRLKADA